MSKQIINKGWAYRETTLIKDEREYMYPLWVTLFTLGKYGAGIYLYFNYIKYMAICLAVMSVISIPALVANLLGSYYEDRSNSTLDFTTLGNTDGFDEGTRDSGKINDEDDTLRYLVIYSDLINTIFFFWFVYAFKYLWVKNTRSILKRTTTASDYSIYVTNLPPTGVTKHDIVEHFAQYGKIEEVTFSRKFGSMMNEYKKQDTLNKKIYKQEVKYNIMKEDK